MEHFAGRGLRAPARFLSVLVFFLLAALTAQAARSTSFSLSTDRTFAPTEKPTIHLYAHNVDVLEFRIYRVNDPAKFLSGLADLHSFQNGSPWGPAERIDERTWLERFHDWKHHVWYLMRRFYRGQFSPDARDYLRRKQSSLARRSRIVGVAEFAQIPLLNSQQLVARWRQEMPPTFISDSQVLPVQSLSSGLYLVEATNGQYKAYTLLMVSRIVLVTRTGNGSILAYAVDRQSGVPISGAQVQMGIGKQELASGKTGADGTVELKGEVKTAAENNLWVVATTGKEFAAVTPSAWAFAASGGPRWASYIYTDRPVYRPGNPVHWKMVLRERTGNSLALPQIKTIRAAITDQQDRTVYQKDLPLSADGTVAGDLVLPADAKPGYYSIRLGRPEDSLYGGFRVEDYRKPEYQVGISAAQPRVLESHPMQVVISARYFFGEPVANGKVKYRIYRTPHFWWGGEGEEESGPFGSASADLYGSSQVSEQSGKLDANGKLTVTVPTELDTSPEHRDFDYVVEAGVTDAANREIQGRGGFLATYGTFRLRVEPVSFAVHTGEAARFHIQAVDYDGKPVQAGVHLALSYRKWSKGKTTVTPGPGTDVTTDAQGNATASVTVDRAGSAEVVASATSATPAGIKREVRSSAWLWVMGSGEAGLYGGPGQLQIVTDKKSYAPGDTAHVGIISDLAGFHALVVAAGYTVEFRQVLSSEGRTLDFDLPSTADSVPNLTVTIIFVKNGQLYQASQDIKVPAAQKRLQVEIVPAQPVFQPEQAAVYDVYTRDSNGKAVSADFSFGAVDEAIYSIYPDASGDMVRTLYPNRFTYAPIDSSLEYYFSGNAGLKSPVLAERKTRDWRSLAQVKPGMAMVQPKVRKAFPDTAYWAPDLHTDSDGHARVSFQFPDSLTTWRATVRAITRDSAAGSAINRVIVRKNVIVRMGTPRFLRKGDEIDIPVIAHNYLDRAKQIQIALQVSGLEVISGAPATLNIESKTDGTAVWRLRASHIGTATLLAKALTNQESDALEVRFPVEPAGVPQTIASSGAMAAEDGSKSVSVGFPGDTDAAAHTIHIEVSPSIAGSLFSALDTLSSFPYGCTEQTMSSFLPDIIVAETLRKLNLPSHTDLAGLTARVDAGFDRLADYQHEDGGWGWWKEDASRVFMTAYVVAGLAQAGRTYPLNFTRRQMLERGVGYLQTQLKDHPRMIPDLRAYVVFSLSEAGAAELQPQLDALWDRRSSLNSQGLALMGLAMMRHSDSRVAETAHLLEGKAHQAGALVSWPSSVDPLLDFESNNTPQSTAFALRFLSHADPESSLLPRAAEWLIANRENGSWWDSTEQTAMAIYGLADYLAASGELKGDFDVDVKLNGAAIAHRHFTPGDAVAGAVLAVDVPATELAEGANTVQVATSGSGRAYWSVRAKYYSTASKAYQKGTMSLNLARDYFRLVPQQQNNKIVYRLEPLRGAAQIGDVLAVHLAVNGTTAKYLMLLDPIPAGTEFISNEDSYEIVDRPNRWSDWFTRREFHDDHAAIFASTFEGRQESFYLLRVVNPGSFTIGPASVEPMYDPSVQATSDALHLDVPSADTAAPPASNGPNRQEDQ